MIVNNPEFRSYRLNKGEAVLKWNGVLPQYVLGNSTPFINLAAAK